MTGPAGDPTSDRYPAWLREIDESLPVNAQFVVTGNIRDTHLLRVSGLDTWLSTVEALQECLTANDYAAVVLHDPVNQVTVLPGQVGAAADAAQMFLSDPPPTGRAPRNGVDQSLDDLYKIIAKACLAGDHRVAVIIDYASRIASNPQDLSDAEQRFFVRMEKLSNDAERHYREGRRSVLLFNPVVWLVNQERDLPRWLVAGNSSIRTITIPLPDFEQRRTMAEREADRLLADPVTGEIEDRRAEAEFCDVLAKQTEGLPLQSLPSIVDHAQDQGIPPGAIQDAVRGYRVGVLENPWKRPYLRDRIKTAEKSLGDRVFGQDEAIRKVHDVLVRSTMSLTGAHSSTYSARPRGVLFFAGPTGVGKTELAKAIAALVFEREDAYVRFDMSEFSAEHTDARLIGAPPGYIGYDAGGELTNAVRERPFSLLLFDEIEKAHPRILDKFLQILEDGRLSDGRGGTTYFSETLLVFTSNLGLYVRDGAGDLQLNVTADIERDQLEQRMRKAVVDHFTTGINRPELLNRIGVDNIVVFNFISPRVAKDLVRLFLRNVATNVRREHQVELRIDPHVIGEVTEMVTGNLDFGARGIIDRLNTAFIDPLGRALFERDFQPGDVVPVVVVDGHNGQREVGLG